MLENLKKKILEFSKEIIEIKENYIKIPIYLLTKKIYNINYEVLYDIYFSNKILERILKILNIKNRIYVEKEIDLENFKIIIYDYVDIFEENIVTKFFLIKWDKFRRLNEKNFSEECYEDLICVNSLAEILMEKNYEIKGIRLIYINKENLDIKEFKSEFLKGMLSIVQSYAMEFHNKGRVSL